MRLALLLSLSLLALLAACAGRPRSHEVPDLGGAHDAATSDGPTLDGPTTADGGGLDASPTGDAGGLDAGAIDGGHDAGALDAGRDAGSVDASRDAGRDAGPIPDGGVTTTFPTMAANTCFSTGTCMPLGAGGSGVHYVSGDYLEETITLSGPSISRLRLSFDMDDMTSGCAAGPPPATNTFDVSVNGVRVGSYSFVTGATVASGRITLTPSFTFTSIAATAGNQYAIRLTATSTVCSGGSSWNWFPGGTATGVSP